MVYGKLYVSLMMFVLYTSFSSQAIYEKYEPKEYEQQQNLIYFFQLAYILSTTSLGTSQSMKYKNNVCLTAFVSLTF
jgi:hypothetical protein